MRITAVRSVLLSHDYGDAPLVWVGGRIETWDAALVEVTTDDGFTGLGEVAQGIMCAAAVPGVVDALRPYAIGADAENPADVSQNLRDHTLFWSRGGLPSGVIGAIENACWDALGKARALPVHALLSDSARPRLEAYASGGLGTDFDQVCAWVAQQEADGFGTVKIRAMTNAATTCDLVDAVALRLRPGTRFILDAVQACASRPWPLEDVLCVGRHLDRHGARWFEEPCRADDGNGYRHAREGLRTPISGVESYGSYDDFERLTAISAVDIVQPDVSMVGGISELRRVAELAAERQLRCVPHIWGSAVTLMSNVHAAFGTDTIDLLEVCTLANPLREALLAEPFPIADGFVSAPTAPGLGVSLADDVERRFPFLPGRGHVIR